jgi:hypothetical protein
MLVLERFARPIHDQEKQRGERFVQNGDVDVHLPADGMLRGMVFDNQQRFDTLIPLNGGGARGIACQCETFKRGDIWLGQQFGPSGMG